MLIEWVDPQLLKPNPKNRNEHSADQIDRLAKLIEYQGWRFPIVADVQNMVWAGHGRLLAAKKLKLKSVPVSYQEFQDEAQAYAFLVSDNAIASWAELDLSGINSDIGDLGPDFDIDLLGIKNFEIDVADREGLCDTDEVPEHVEPRTQPGDLYALGRHRLLCGDATVLDHVDRLMGGEKSDMCFTSPPYNLGTNAKLRGYNGDGKDTVYREKSDQKTESEYLDFLMAFTNNVLTVSNTAFINIQCLAGNKFVIPEYWYRNSQRLIDVMVWDKEHAAPQMAARVLNSVWEFVFIFGNEDYPTRSMKHGQNFRGTIDNIYRLNPNGKKDPLAKDHGAVFPVQFAEHFVSNFSDEKVLDIFGGSGSTLIACEKTNRKCFMMEIDPHYCDVIVARWEKFTGKKAELVNG